MQKTTSQGSLTRWQTMQLVVDLTRRFRFLLLMGSFVCASIGYLLFTVGLYTFISETEEKTSTMWAEIFTQVFFFFALFMQFASIFGRLQFNSSSPGLSLAYFLVLTIAFLCMGASIRSMGDMTRMCDGQTLTFCNEAYVSFTGIFFLLLSWVVFSVVFFCDVLSGGSTAVPQQNRQQSQSSHHRPDAISYSYQSIGSSAPVAPEATPSGMYSRQAPSSSPPSSPNHTSSSNEVASV